MVGFATRAGACSFGAGAVEAGVKSGKIKLVLADEGLSPASQRAAESLCAYWQVPLVRISPPGELGRACGRPQNKLVGVTAAGFADRITAICAETKRESEV